MKNYFLFKFCSIWIFALNNIVQQQQQPTNSHWWWWSKKYQYWIRYVIFNYDTFLFFLFLFWNVCFGSHRFLATMTKTVVVVPWFQRNRNGFFFPKNSNRVVALVFPCKTTTTQAIWILFTIKQWKDLMRKK